MGTFRLQSGAKSPGTSKLPSKTKKPIITCKSECQNKSSNLKPDKIGAFKTESCKSEAKNISNSIVHSAKKMKGVLRLKMAALRSEHQVLSTSIRKEKVEINEKFNNLFRIENGMQFVNNEVDGLIRTYLGPRWSSGETHVERIQPDLIGDVFV